MHIKIIAYIAQLLMWIKLQDICFISIDNTRCYQKYVNRLYDSTQDLASQYILHTYDVFIFPWRLRMQSTFCIDFYLRLSEVFNRYIYLAYTARAVQLIKRSVYKMSENNDFGMKLKSYRKAREMSQAVLPFLGSFQNL